ncbi:Protein of unknown function [Gryllus bimaculatus]|nr:Protein of unknown function [Gryllus bimaculatus]
MTWLRLGVLQKLTWYAR